MLSKLMVNYKPFTGLADICLECKLEHPYGLYMGKTRGTVIDDELTNLINTMRFGEVSKPSQDKYDRLKELLESEREEIGYKVIAEECNSKVTAQQIQEALDSQKK